MRTIAVTAVALIASVATAASAAPASVHVTVGPELQKKAVKTYGVRDVDGLASDLKKDVERSLARTGALQDARVELTLVDVKPNRPTFKQLGDVPGLSFQSFGVGGAKIEGRAIAADGTVTPLSYQWYESDIRWAQNHSTWQDARNTFGRFAYRLGRGHQLASR